MVNGFLIEPVNGQMFHMQLCQIWSIAFRSGWISVLHIWTALHLLAEVMIPFLTT